VCNKMEKGNYKMKKLVIWMAFVLAFFFVIPQQSLAGSEDLQVAGRYRLMSECFEGSNTYFGIYSPFNTTSDRVWMYETSRTNPKAECLEAGAGRGFVYGTIADLKSWSSVADYKTKAKPFPAGCTPYKYWALWSPIAGEENYVYMACDSGWIKKFDTSASVPAWENVIDTGSGQITCYGFDAANKLICDTDGETPWDTLKAITVTGTPTSADITASNRTCGSFQWYWYNGLGALGSHGHSDISPSALFGTKYGSGVSTSGVYRLSDCNFTVDPIQESPYFDHTDYHASNDYFLTKRSPEASGVTSPGIVTDYLTQRYFNQSTMAFGDSNDFLAEPTARWWWNGTTLMDYHGALLPSCNNDCSKILYTSTNGKYSYDDYLYNSAYQPWEFYGVFLVETAVTGESDTTPPAAPSGLSVQ